MTFDNAILINQICALFAHESMSEWIRDRPSHPSAGWWASSVYIDRQDSILWNHSGLNMIPTHNESLMPPSFGIYDNFCC
jgi:hypothetical protein